MTASNYGIRHPVVFYDVPKAEEGRSRTGSRFCKDYANLALILLEDLLAAGFGTSKPCTIALLTP